MRENMLTCSWMCCTSPKEQIKMHQQTLHVLLIIKLLQRVIVCSGCVGGWLQHHAATQQPGDGVGEGRGCAYHFLIGQGRTAGT